MWQRIRSLQHILAERPGVKTITIVILLVAVLWFEARYHYDTGVWPILNFLLGLIVCPMALISAVRYLYLFARRARWLVRKNREKETTEDIRIPANVAPAQSFDDIDVIHDAQTKALTVVPDAQGLFRARALTTFMAPAIAVFLTGLQVANWPSGPFAAGLIAGQVILFAMVLIRIVTDRRPTDEWIKRRTRVELLRREQYLRLARVGPYAPGEHCTVGDRIQTIHFASLETMTNLVIMEYGGARAGQSWFEGIMRHPPNEPIFADLAARLDTYRYHRVDKQIGWMRVSGEQAESDAKLIGIFVAIVTLLATLLALYNTFVFLSVQPAGTVPANALADAFNKTITLRGSVELGAFLPALAGGLLALQNVFNLRFLAQNYRLTAKFLERVDLTLTSLGNDLHATSDAAQTQILEARFQRSVLHVESALTEEYTRWRMITERDAYEFI